MLTIPARPIAAASTLRVVGNGSSAILQWDQPSDSDTAIVLRRRNPQLIAVLRLIAGPQTVVDNATQSGDTYWITFWSADGSYRSMTRYVTVHWEQRFPLVSE